MEYLAALAFLQLPLHWVDAGELCLTEQPLALLQSERLTAVFFHLRLPRTSFHGCRLLRADQQHTNARTLPLRTSGLSLVDLSLSVSTKK